MTERFALYYAPVPTHPLWIKAALWLGRDPAAAAVVAADIPGIDTEYRWRIAESARRYGFHATLKAPMVLIPGVAAEDLASELDAFGRRNAPAAIGRLQLSFIDGFLALVPVEQTGALTEMAGRVVTHFELFRAPLSAGERERRARGLTPAQAGYVERYGYPYVLDEFRFHMTLTDRLPESERDPVMAAAEGWFGALLAESFTLDRIAVYHEAEAGAPFTRRADHPLTARMTVDA